MRAHRQRVLDEKLVAPTEALLQQVSYGHRATVLALVLPRDGHMQEVGAARLGALLRRDRQLPLLVQDALLRQLVVGALQFASFHKLGYFLSLDLAERQLLVLSRVSVRVTHLVYVFGAVCVARPALAPTDGARRAH